MKSELERIYDYFKSLKSNSTYSQYFNDIEVNNSIINQNPFIQEIAETQISIMNLINLPIFMQMGEKQCRAM